VIFQGYSDLNLGGRFKWRQGGFFTYIRTLNTSLKMRFVRAAALSIAKMLRNSSMSAMAGRTAAFEIVTNGREGPTAAVRLWESRAKLVFPNPSPWLAILVSFPE